MPKRTPTETRSGEGAAPVQPACVVEQIALPLHQGQSYLVTYGCGPQLGNVGLNERAPACEPVQPQPNRNALIRMDCEHLCGVAVAASEERCTGLFQCRPGLPTTEGETDVDDSPVRE